MKWKLVGVAGCLTHNYIVYAIMLKILKYKSVNIEFGSQISRPSGPRMFCYAYNIVWISLCWRRVPGVRVLASVSCLPVHWQTGRIFSHATQPPVVLSTCKNKHNRDAPQAQTHPKYMVSITEHSQFRWPGYFWTKFNISTFIF